MAYKCLWCGKMLRMDPANGWVHPGGGVYVVKCRRCRRTWDHYPAPVRCPVCGEPTVDDHAVRPVPVE